MDICNVRLSAIDFEDESLRISDDLDLDRMCASLRAAGLIHPVVLAPGARPGISRIVCGFRRLHALRRLQIPEAAAILPDAGSAPFDLFHKALWDNLAHRHLSPVECARVLSKLAGFGVPEPILVNEYLSVLGLAPHRNVLASYLKLDALDPEIGRLLKTGAVTLATAVRVTEYEHDAQAAFAAMMADVRFSASRQRELLDVLEDLAAISNVSVAARLRAPDVAALVGDASLSPFQKGEKLYAHLYGRRYPRLTDAREKFRARRAALNVSGAIRISADPYFETPRLRVEFEAGSAAEFRESVAALWNACGTRALDGLFE